MTSLVKQIVQTLTLLVEDTWSLPHLETTNRTNFEALSTLVAVVDEVHKSIDNPLHGRQETLFLQIVVERTSADVCPGNVRTDGIEVDILFW